MYSVYDELDLAISLKWISYGIWGNLIAIGGIYPLIRYITLFLLISYRYIEVLQGC